MKLRKCNLVLTTLLSLYLTSLATAADRPDFSGEWNLNIVKSDFGGQKLSPIGELLKINHKDPVLMMTRTIASDKGVITTELAYSTDGRETTNKSYAALGPEGVRQIPGGLEMRNIARWEDSALVIETPVSMNGSNFSIKWKWILSADGKTLETVRTFGPGERPQREIYERK
jgi:hypothetical protein